MNSDFNNIASLAAQSFGESFVPRGECAFSLVLDEGTISFASVLANPAMALVRMRVLDLSVLPRKGGLALAALEGNFFWSGTNGGTLSVGEDGGLWLTERRPVDELAAPGGLSDCVSSFTETAFEWRERSELHG